MSREYVSKLSNCFILVKANDNYTAAKRLYRASSDHPPSPPTRRFPTTLLKLKKLIPASGCVFNSYLFRCDLYLTVAYVPSVSVRYYLSLIFMK